MKNRCEDYSYFSLNALSYLTTLLIGIAFGLSISIMTFHLSENIYKSTVYLICLIISLVVLGIVFRGITIYFWYKSKVWAVAKKTRMRRSQSVIPLAPCLARALVRFFNKLGAPKSYMTTQPKLCDWIYVLPKTARLAPLKFAIIQESDPRSPGHQSISVLITFRRHMLALIYKPMPPGRAPTLHQSGVADHGVGMRVQGVFLDSTCRACYFTATIYWIWSTYAAKVYFSPEPGIYLKPVNIRKYEPKVGLCYHFAIGPRVCI